jgi:1-pyrroline-5-carboxylate dehydrogenase
MLDGTVRPPVPQNEPVLSYAPGSPERATLKAALTAMKADVRELPMFVGGRALETGATFEVRAPHEHRRVLARAHEGGVAETLAAIAAAEAARPSWSELPFHARAAVFLRAAELAATTWRARLNASTMLGQSKTAHQAEIDAACELVDFLRFNVAFAARLGEEQPLCSPGTWNQLELRPLDGFVLAVTPFNFTAIAANLPSAPALLGNTVVWKPSPLAALSNHVVMELFRAAGLPDGVINLVQGPPQLIVDAAMSHEAFAGLHFTGSTAVFQALWRKASENLARARSYPRLVGETGGKDFVLAHASADVDALAVALARGAFEFQGQKCSAASRAYVPASLWPAVRERLVEHVRAMRVGDVCDFRTFMGAVIDERAFARLAAAQAEARADATCTIVTGGGADASLGYFVEPTVVETTNPRHRLMETELFGPLLTLFVYPDAELERTLELVDTTSPYALTGAVFARDRAFLVRATKALRHAAGNFYLNDKPTGAVVGQQPFGGGRGSGTNDKAGSAWNLMRWASPRVLKETLAPPTTLLYPSHLGED